MYMIYLCIVDLTNIYRYAMYLILYIIILTLDTITLKRLAKNSYLIGILLMIITMVIFTSELVVAITLALVLLAIAIYMIICKMKQGRNKQIKSDNYIAKQISIAFYLGTSNIIVLILVLLNSYYV